MDNKSQISSITFKQTIYVDRTKKKLLLLLLLQLFRKSLNIDIIPNRSLCEASGYNIF